ncbi:hypothetical protein KY309_02400 [Candidatus Woesearchaeota archaeon]|nr:hypothetical protein [Candidatus Woesearchaeota archaeon]MBW3016437.1 hypothetical protein [Candidatus Woesearchaeota archaeon]
MANETLAMEPEAPAPAKKGLFGPKTPPPPETSPATEQINLLTARLRVGEERYSELRKKFLVVEQNMLSNHKKAMAEIKALQTELNEMKRTIQAVEDKIITIIKELRLTARKEDIDVMKKYLDIWDPVKFVTSEQVEKIIDDKLGKKEKEKPPTYDSPT